MQLIAQPNETNPEQNKTRTQLAQTFNTNPRYISDAAIAVEAEDLIAIFKAEAKAAQAKFHGNQYVKKSGLVSLMTQVQKIDPEQNKVRTQLAQTFNTNPRYISDAAIAVEAEDLIAIFKAEAKAAQAKFHGNQYVKKSGLVELIPQVQKIDPEQNKARTQLAQTFNTNPRYISDAAIAVEAEDLIAVFKAEAKAAQIRKPIDSVPSLMTQQNSRQNESRTQLAQTFNTSA